MNQYTVRWEINVFAETALDAAIETASDYFQKRIQQGSPETACVFNVEQEGKPDDSEMIDLSKVAGSLNSLQLRKMYGEEGHPDYLQYQWRLAIDREDTLLGYWEWVAHQLEEDARS